MTSLSLRASKARLSRNDLAWVVLRVSLAGLVAVHGWARFVQDAVVPFGGWLESQGLPWGFALAVGVTAVEILGTPLYTLGRLVVPLSLVYSGIYLVGIVLVHAEAGWFVVGLGRNGAEYSVLLIVCFLCVGLRHAGSRKKS